ncbi:hypothetical protein CAPTEDRAFT_194616 [Capitella teleta]|uniref:C2H2-type domain-containing protein n=1 Tax=Capitella teleta TaxID=283909 RepID=R7VE12_CAPTE|nr:hypothetical protein CAPTEDRAFT_194616 [Capitella teleta]|eukprot:ELU17078.1 hypothetical protein CAPTEDRAFT_194616 [Capitella teleta]
MHVGCLKRVVVERDSVNSISLHENPQSHVPRMMVASGVGLNPAATKLIARNTTLMPDIPGLHALLSITFAPCVEFRTDPKRTRYIGALCGLGWDSETQGPALPDHDMEITFGVEFTKDDISMINQVRAAINLAVREGSWSFDVIRKIQHTAKEKLLRLVQKVRKPIPETPFQQMYRWRMVDPDLLEHPATDNDERDFLTLLCGIELNEHVARVEPEQHAREERMQLLRQHCDWLRSVHGARLKKQDIHCQLCDVMLRNPAELLLHLQTKHHKQQEELLK